MSELNREYTQEQNHARIISGRYSLGLYLENILWEYTKEVHMRIMAGIYTLEI